MIKNKNYKAFLDGEPIEYVEEQHLKQALENIDLYSRKGRREEGKALLIMLYYTGCRPAEALLCKAKQIEKDRTYIKIKLKTLKGGRARTIWLNTSIHPLTKILFEWRKKHYEEELLFFNFIGRYKHNKLIKKADGTEEMKEYIDISAKLNYHFNKWFKEVFDGGVNPYYLRHNKFSKLAERGKVSDRQLMQLKGARSYESIAPYIHTSELEGKKVSKYGG